MADLSVNKKAINAATAVDTANANTIAAQASRAEASALFFEPAAKIGADFTMLAKPTGDDAKNNLWVATRQWAYDVCATVLAGEAGLAFLKDATTTGKAEMAITQGRMKGQTRDKKYIQQQVGKLIGLIKADLKKAADKPDDGASDAVERTDCDRFLDAIAKAAKQCSKAKPDDSIPAEYVEAFNEMLAKLK
jgi:hypothetical protein